MARVIVFDVNETLLDLKALDPHFRRLFGSETVRGEWFRQVLMTAMTVTLTGHYHDFTKVGAAALTMVAERHGVSLTEEDRQEIAYTMRQLPPHPEVPAALQRLHDAGLRLVALTNSAPPAMHAQLSNAGLDHLFEQEISVESARQLKPALAVYRTAASKIGVDTAEMLMVAAHGWDLAGAMSAGCGAAFVARPGQVMEPLFPRPEIVGADMTEVAEAIVATET
jgi:2-haloacid dehalogenase